MAVTTEPQPSPQGDFFLERDFSAHRLIKHRKGASVAHVQCLKYQKLAKCVCLPKHKENMLRFDFRCICTRRDMHKDVQAFRYKHRHAVFMRLCSSPLEGVKYLIEDLFKKKKKKRKLTPCSLVPSYLMLTQWKNSLVFILIFTSQVDWLVGVFFFESFWCVTCLFVMICWVMDFFFSLLCSPFYMKCPVELSALSAKT